MLIFKIPINVSCISLLEDFIIVSWNISRHLNGLDLDCLSDIITCQLQCNTRILCKFIMFETLLIYSTAHLLHHITIN